MPSYYDPKKTCRVGMMDESQFYEECSKVTGLYFRALIAALVKCRRSAQVGRRRSQPPW